MQVTVAAPDELEPAPPLVPMVGRDDLLATLLDLVLDPGVRLVTLIGPGGIGKTHLAVVAATRYQARTGNRVRVVALTRDDAGAIDPASLALIAGETGDAPDLLVLDGAEHLPAAAVSDLLAAHPNLTLVATSRRPLRIMAERLLPVPPLPSPGAHHVTTVDDLGQFAACRLFLAAAAMVAPEITLGDDQALAIAAICDGLGGLPLALLLAARRLRARSPDDLAATQGNPLDLASGGPMDAPPRLQSMRASIAWSHDLLSEDERVGFRRLGVFPETFTLDAASCLVALDPAAGDDGDALAIVSSLIDQSLLQRAGADGGSTRYWLDPLTRAFARERLVAAGEDGEASSSLARWCLDLIGCATPGCRDEAWLARLSDEAGNIRIAREWIREGQAWHQGFLLVDRLYDFWLIRGCSAGERRWLQDLLDAVPVALPGAGAHHHARLLHLLGLLSHSAAEFDDAERAYQSALAIRQRLPDRGAELDTRHNLALLAQSRGDYERARTLFEAPVASARHHGDNQRLASSLCYLASVQNALGDHDQAWQSIQEAGIALREDPNPKGYAFYLVSLGEIIWDRGMHEEAEARWLECLRRYTLLGDTHAMASAQLHLSLAWRHDRRVPEAAGANLAAIRILADRSDPRFLAEAFVSNAALAVLTGAHHWAGQAVGAGDALVEEIGAVHIPPVRDERARSLRAVRNAIGDHALETALVVGQGMAVAEAIALAESFAASLVDVATPLHQPVALPDLTPRERDVLRLLVSGQTNREIGDVLSLGHRTVATHVSNLLAKFDVSTRAALAGAAVRLGTTGEPDPADPGLR